MTVSGGADRTSSDLELDAFDDVYERCFPPVWSYAVSRVGRQAAEDVVSETFAIAWRRQTSIPVDALPWLLCIARNVVFDSYRVAARQRLIDMALRTRIAVVRANEPDIAESIVDRDQALTALASLSERDRELLMLIAWHGLSPRRAARVLGCSRPAFFVRLHRARGRLERALDRHAAANVSSDPLSVARTHNKRGTP